MHHIQHAWGVILRHTASDDDPQSSRGVNTLDTIVNDKRETKVEVKFKASRFTKVKDLKVVEFLDRGNVNAEKDVISPLFLDIDVNIKVSVDWGEAEDRILTSTLQT